MPSVLYENTASGFGSDSLGATSVLYVGWEVTVQGRRVRAPFAGDSGLLNGVGVLAFGNDLTAAGIITGVAWLPEIWLNWQIGQWFPDPPETPAGFSTLLADHVRWSFSEGTTVHWYVFG